LRVSRAGIEDGQAMDLYKVLGVRRAATAAEVRRAYQKRARELHPDLNPGDPVAAERFAAISEAFAVLSDPQRRAAYDRGETAAAPAAPPDVGFEGFDFSAEVKTERVTFQEIFEGVLTRDDTGSTRGEDLEQVASVTFDECFHGAVRRLQVVRQDRCPGCAGSGDITAAPLTCLRCRGAGVVRGTRGHMIFSRRCPSCGGAGVIRTRACPRCEGEGRTMQSEWIDVRIPPGVSDGSRVRLHGGGNAGRRGGAAGDFVLTVKVEPHPHYRREGHDLHTSVPVTVVEAAIGAHVDVPTPDGTVPIEIPAGTQPGQKFRLRKRGVPHLGGGTRGDLYVEVHVKVPTVTDDPSRALLQAFAERHPENPRLETQPDEPERKKA
jgi:molecular chaperone DnaJ